jgi:hypothetical protein
MSATWRRGYSTLEILTLPKIRHTATLGQEKKGVEGLKKNGRRLVNGTLAK